MPFNLVLCLAPQLPKIQLGLKPMTFANSCCVTGYSQEEGLGDHNPVLRQLDY